MKFLKYCFCMNYNGKHPATKHSIKNEIEELAAAVKICNYSLIINQVEYIRNHL